MGYKNAASILPPDLLSRVQNFHTGMLWVPKTQPKYYEDRNRRIMQLKQSGLTDAQIAREVGLSIRQVKRIISFIRNGAGSEI
ncbi:MAG: hypothetical protein E3J72_00960 [Planctomycetota bacterium]|nr:MAG: hypothetical protein E3J72_00960 [Planctomycetota bacterium]